MSISSALFRLKRAVSERELIAIINEFMNEFHIDSFAFTFYNQVPSALRKIQYDYASPALLAWHEYYLSNDFEDSDQTLQWSKLALEPVYWSIEEQTKNSKSTREHRIRAESKAFGIDSGICFPIHGPTDDFAVLVVHQRQGQVCLSNAASFAHELHIFAYYFYAAIKNILRKSDISTKKCNLTARETQCLELTAENFNAAQIAKILSITPRTVHFHIQNAIKKLGVNNKYQAAFKLKDLS